jgi:hypothetical protein
MPSLQGRRYSGNGAMSGLGREKGEEVNADAGDEEGTADADEGQEGKRARPDQTDRFGQEAEDEQGAGDLEPTVYMVSGLGHGCALHILAFASVPTL